MENKKILLPNKKYIGSSDKDIQLRIDLDSSVKNSIEGMYNYTLNANSQFKIERGDSELFRPYIKVSGMYYSNGINNPFISNYYKSYNTNYTINNNSLSNIDFLYDPNKTVVNTNVLSANGHDVQYTAMSAIFSISAPYDDIIITNISPLTTISNNTLVELIDYWYLPTDIKKDGSYSASTFTNIPNNPIIVSASTGWINIGKFLTGTTEVDFSNSNVIGSNLFTFRGNMGIKIPKYQTYSFFVTVKTGGNGYLKTSFGNDSVAGFMASPQSISSGDTQNIKSNQQYCWLNIFPDSYELTSSTVSNISYRDYYGWTNVNSSNVYTFTPEMVVSASTNTTGFKGVINYKIVQDEPYQYRTQKLLSYNDYYDSVVPSKQYLEFLNNNIENWDIFSMYSSDKDNAVSLYITESGFTNTFIIGNGIPAKYNSGLTLLEISSTTNTVFNSYMEHNLSIGDYVIVKQVSGGTTTDIGVFPVISIGSKNNTVSSRTFTIKLTGFTGSYIQFKRYLDINDSGSLSQYYVRKYKVIENSDNYTLTTPLSKNGFGNNFYYLTNKSEVDITGLNDENGVPIGSISYFFKKKNIINTTTQTITKIKNKFYDKYYKGRDGFISREIYKNNTNFFISGTSTHNTIDYGLGLMVSGLTNTYRDGSITSDNVVLSDDTFIFDTDVELGIGTYIDFTDGNTNYEHMTGLTRSIVYRKGDDFNYNSKRYFSLFSEYLKKPISNTSGNTLSMLGVKPTLTNFGSSQIAGSSLYPGNSMVLINNQLSEFPIGGTIYYTTASTDSLTSATILGYELGGLYAVINDSRYSSLTTTGYTNVYSLQYYGDTYNIKLSNLIFDNYVVYYLDGNETKLSISDTINIGDTVYGDIVEYNERELKTYVLQNPNYLFKLKDLYGYTGSTNFSAVTATYGKTDLLYPVRLKYFTDIIYRSSNIEDKVSWAVFNSNSNLWEWRNIIPNGEIDNTGKGTNFPFLNGRHYIYNDFILPFRSKYWNPVYGNTRSLSFNSNYNYNNGFGDLQTINNIEDC